MYSYTIAYRDNYMKYCIEIEHKYKNTIILISKLISIKYTNNFIYKIIIHISLMICRHDV